MKITVSDHALVRFLERVGEIDMTTFREHIAGLVLSAMKAGATSVRIDGFMYILDPVGGVVKTILTPQQAKLSHGFSGRLQQRKAASNG